MSYLSKVQIQKDGQQIGTVSTLDISSGNNVGVSSTKQGDKASVVIEGTGRYNMNPITLQIPSNGILRIDASTGSCFKIKLDKDLTLDNFINPVDIQRFFIVLTQDSVGYHSLSLGSKFRLHSSMTDATLLGAPDTVHYVSVIYYQDQDEFHIIGLVKGL